MKDIDKIVIKYMPEITDDQLWNFYVKNDICEVGFGKETAVKPLKYNPYIVGAFLEGNLVGFIRATFDGLSANIMEFCLDCELQGENLRYNNGSLIECDKYGIAKLIGAMLINELRKIGNTFISAYIVEGVEESVYHSIGLFHNKGHLQFIKDDRPYI
jgi:hypothetical protein